MCWIPNWYEIGCDTIWSGHQTHLRGLINTECKLVWRVEIRKPLSCGQHGIWCVLHNCQVTPSSVSHSIGRHFSVGVSAGQGSLRPNQWLLRSWLYWRCGAPLMLNQRIPHAGLRRLRLALMSSCRGLWFISPMCNVGRSSSGSLLTMVNYNIDSIDVTRNGLC